MGGRWYFTKCPDYRVQGGRISGRGFTRTQNTVLKYHHTTKDHARKYEWEQVNIVPANTYSSN